MSSLRAPVAAIVLCEDLASVSPTWILPSRTFTCIKASGHRKRGACLYPHDPFRYPFHDP